MTYRGTYLAGYASAGDDGTLESWQHHQGDRYRLTFTAITPLDRPDLFTEAGTPKLNAHDIPVAEWSAYPPAVREATGDAIAELIQQYYRVRAWAASGKHYVWNVSLEMAAEPEWERVLL